MTSEIWIVFGIIVGMIGLFIWDRLPVIAVCMMASLALYFSGILNLGQSLAGFGDPAVIFVAALFVVSAGLEMTGVTAWAGQVLIARAGESRTMLMLWMIGFAAVLSALISVNGSVAALLPVVIVMAIRLGRVPGQLLMPLVFGAHAGSMMLLTGTPVNVLISEASADIGAGGFSYFSFALIGVPLVLGSAAIMILFGERLLPTRPAANLPPDLSQHAKTLIEQYQLTGEVHRVKVLPGSPLVGSLTSTLDLTGHPGIGFVALQNADGTETGRGGAIVVGDHLVMRGEAGAVAQFAADLVLSFDDRSGPGATLFNRGSGLAEVVIPPRSALIGAHFFPGMVTPSGDLIVLAVQRRGENMVKNAPLAAGDTILMQGTWGALDQRLAAPEVLVINAPEVVRRQAVPMGEGAKRMLVVLTGMVLLLATNAVPPAVAGLLAAGVVVIGRILSVEQVYRAINWTTVILMGALMPLAPAMEKTGAAKMLADGLISVLGESGPRALLAGLFLLTGALGQVISNTATAVIIIPISVVAATQMGISPQPVLMCVGIAAAAAFLTPVSTATNLMVLEPGGYKFGDYWKLGLPLMVWFFVIAVFLVPVVWPF